MRRSCFMLCLTLCVPGTPFADDSAVDLTKIDRTILHEPDYRGQPHYALFVFGPAGEHRSWLVIDGDSVAYIDRNGNGDLTDPEDRVELDVEATSRINLRVGAYKAMHVFPLGEVFGTKLTFRLWVRNPDFDASQNDFYRDLFRTYDEHQWVNGSLMRGAEDGSESQNPLLLTVRPEDAQIARFGGPLTAALKWDDRQRLEPWPKQFTFDINLGCRNLLARDCNFLSFGMTRLTMTEVPPSVQPVATMEFPDDTVDGRPLTREVRLDRRCCGDTFYAVLTLPQGITSKSAKVCDSPGLSDISGGENYAAVTGA